MEKLNFKFIKNKIDGLKSSIQDCNVQMLYIYGYGCNKNKFNNLFLSFKPDDKSIPAVISAFNKNKKDYKYISIGIRYNSFKWLGDRDIYILKN